jgi:hypothetical protein
MFTGILNQNAWRGLIATMALCGMWYPAIAQLSIDPQLRTRTELRQGYMSLRLPDQDPAFFTEQRTRLSFAYSTSRFRIRVTPQDVRLWGQAQTTTSRSESSFSLYEAWAEVKIFQDSSQTRDLTLQVGRQMLNYDDERILGGLDWASQGRRHDLALLQYNHPNHRLHFGLAFNQVGPPILFNATYIKKANDDYKALQFLHYQGKYKEYLKGSFLAMNEMFQETTALLRTLTRSTLGGILKFSYGRLKADISGYYQFGTEPGSRANLRAFMAAGLLNYSLTTRWDVSLGYDYLSGNDIANSNPSQSRFFNPAFGTNHKFYGYMDYFYVGTAHNSSGLQDGYLRLRYTSSPRFNIFVDVHNFASAGAVHEKTASNSNKLSSYTGTEADFIINYIPVPYCKIQFGYSALAANRSLEVVKGAGNSALFQQWTYLMVTFQPEKPLRIKLQD